MSLLSSDQKILIDKALQLHKEGKLQEAIKLYSELLDKDRILAITKCDMLDTELKNEIKKTLPKKIDTILISSIAQEGLVKLKDLIWKKLNNS